jgi:hypothetical protein
MFIVTAAALFIGLGGERLLGEDPLLGPVSIPVWTLWIIIAGCVVTVVRRLLRITLALKK